MSSTPNNSLPEEIQNLGRKARARLEIERSKRREIHRVEVLAPQEQRKETQPHSALIEAVHLETSKKAAARAIPKKRKRVVHKKPNADVAADARIVDRWIPDVSSIAVPTTKKISNIVQLHGLPVETTTSHIQRFFSGLDPQRILYIPATPLGAHILELDAKSVGPPTSVQRLDARTRVFVKFQSAPTATLAVQRSGEILSATETKGAAIAVTSMPKNVATYLLKTLAVDYGRHDTIQSFGRHMELVLDPAIPAVLWEAAINDLGLALEANDVVNQAGRVQFLIFDNYHREDIQQHAKELRLHQDRLSKEIDRLKQARPFPAAEALDPAMSTTDPVLHLSCQCVAILEMELERINDALAVTRRWDLLLATRTNLARCVNAM
jgi:hypothetical protein